MHIDGAIKRGEAFAEHFLAQMFTRYHLAEVLGQQIQQGELGACQFQRFTVKTRFLTARIQAQGVDFQRR